MSQDMTGIRNEGRAELCFMGSNKLYVETRATCPKAKTQKLKVLNFACQSA